jgi:hypothetical protein
MENELSVRKNKLSVSFPELVLVAATRGMIGAGVGLLLANKLSRKQRKELGLPLLIAGALSTIPIGLHLFRGKSTETEH